MNQKFKLVAFDIDGTILDKSNNVCEKLKEIVSVLRNKGYLFTIVSARMPLSGLKIAQDLGLTKEEIIVLNGSMIINQNREVIYSKTFSYSRVANILANLDKRISRNYYHGFNWTIENHSKNSDFEISFLQKELEFSQVLELPKLGSAPEFCNKITLTGEHNLLTNAQELLMEDKSLLVGFSHENYMEISCNTISKFSGLLHYTKQLNIKMSEVIAFGDGENDIPMLSNVGLGVAMGNALPHIKSIAKDVAGNHDEAGVANYLESLLNTGIL